MMGVNGVDSDFPDYVEIDPTGRYGRYNKVLGKGASKTVYKAFDEYEGIEVAWNQVKLYDFLQSPEDLERLYCEIHLLKTLKHSNLMKFYTSWVDVSKRNINFVTEMFTSGTLRQYREKHKRVNLRAVKNWCRQILSGLLYLHSHDPPIIHRDLKCDNIFINGNTGEVKIGDLGLAAILRKSHAVNCVGTPEFMAPEVYEEEYNELVDIYSFGMCVLEMVTFEYPYSECTHPVQIYKKVISGTKPEALYKVEDQSVREFVEKCLANAPNRLSAKELLNDPFLQTDQGSFSSSDLDFNFNFNLPRGNLVKEASFSNSSIEDQGGMDECCYWENDENAPHVVEAHKGIDLFHGQGEEEDEEQLSGLDVSIKGKRKDDGGIFLRLRISDKEGRVRNIYFPFDTETDTAFLVATEMVAELDITDHEVTRLAEMIDGEVALLVPGWKPEPGFDKNPASNSYCQNCASNVSSCGSLLDYIGLEVRCTNVECGCMRGRFEEVVEDPDPVLEVQDPDPEPVKTVNSNKDKVVNGSNKVKKSCHVRKLSLVTLGKIESFHLGTNNSYRVPWSESNPDPNPGLDSINVSNGFYARTMSMR